jgi:shikimate dehydrogenase
MRVYGIIGYPLGHSFSQRFFSEKFLQQGIIGCSYEVFPLKSVDELPALLQQQSFLCGLNVTIPHKQHVIALLDDISYLPKGLQACNCIKISKGKLTGYNTDVIGFEKSLLPQLQPHHTHALILGNGGAAEAVKFVLRKLNIAYKVVSRQLHQEHLTYSLLNANILRQHTLIINTTPLGTFPNVSECPDIPYEAVTEKHYCFDLVYNPEKTFFLQKAELQGAAIKNGYDMLVIQAEESWRIWNSSD